MNNLLNALKMQDTIGIIDPVLLELKVLQTSVINCCRCLRVFAALLPVLSCNCRSGERQAAHRMRFTRAGGFHPRSVLPMKQASFKGLSKELKIAVCILNQGAFSVGTYPTENLLFCCWRLRDALRLSRDYINSGYRFAATMRR